MIEAMGGELEKVVVNDLHEHTFIATLHIRRDGGTIEVDSRPSDAIALGAAFDTPIFVAEHVLQAVLREQTTPEERLDILRERLGVLNERIAEISRLLGDEQFLTKSSEEEIAEYRRQVEEMRSEYKAIREVLYI